MTEAGSTHDLVVPPDLDGQRADRVVAGMLGVSRSESRRLADVGAIVAGGRALGASDRVRTGDRLVVTQTAAPAGMVPLEGPLCVRYTSPEVLVVDKPPGLVVHPGAGHRDDTLANILVFHFPDLAELGEPHRWGLVHRLDRETSGLLLVARSASSHEALQEQLKRREIGREYLALANRLLDPASGTIEAPVGRDPEQPTRMALRRDGRFARTHYQRVAGWDDLSLLAVTLDTGRTHQIRVHLASIDAPLVGDKTYGRRSATGGDPGRVWLHAHRLTFADPARPAERVEVTSPLPEDLAASLAGLGDPTTGAIPASAEAESPA